MKPKRIPLVTREKYTYYVRDDDDGCEQIESIVDCIDHMKPPFKITIEQIDVADIPVSA